MQRTRDGEEGPKRVTSWDSDEELEQARVALEDAREEAARYAHALEVARKDVQNRDDLLRQVQAERDALQLAQQHLEQRFLFEEMAASKAQEELRVAFEELQINAEELEDSNTALAQLNKDLEQRVAERTASLSLTSARLRTVTDAVPDMLWASHTGGHWTWANRRWVEYTGVDEPRTHGLGWLDAIHPEDREQTLAAWAEADNSGVLRVEHRIRQRRDGQWRWFSTHGLPVQRLQSEEEPEWFGCSTDIDDARRTELALRDSEARFRGFAEATPDVPWMLEASSGIISFVGPSFARIWGCSWEQTGPPSGHWVGNLHPEDRERAMEILPTVMGGRSCEREYRILRAETDEVRWIRDTAFPLHQDGRVVFAAGLARDITEQRLYEDQQRLLLLEMDHRVKNVLSVVQALAVQTARVTTALPNFSAAFGARLRAFAQAQDLLIRRNRRGIFLADVADLTLSTYNTNQRIRWSGPPIPLFGETSVSLHMALHELATNAVKHGALSQPDGQVRLTWSVVLTANQENRLTMLWQENIGSGPMPALAERRGFGRRLLEIGLPRQLRGTASLTAVAEGLRYELSFTLA